MLCFVVTPGIFSANAQNITTLIQFTNVWKYDQSGLELGTAWRTNDYDDSGWSSGPGLLGAEPDTPAAYTLHAPITTPLAISSTVTTFYFRTTFEFTGSTNGLSLVATNLVDDGCAIYLNGLRAGGVRAQPSYNANTFFAGPTMEGQLDVVVLASLDALRQGTNLLAVEVHQSSSTSSDIMWGMKLLAIQHTPLVITNQPQSQTLIAGNPATLSVGVSGGPAFYRWQKDGVNIVSATNSSYVISSAQLGNSGEYRVIITNSISAVTSSVATLTVVADLAGPRIIAAIGNDSAIGSVFASNTIHIIFSEVLNVLSAQNTNNYTVTLLGTTNTVPVVRAVYSMSLGILLTMDTTDPDWIYGRDYVLTVNGVRDISGNVIAPDSQITVAWPRSDNLLAADAAWSFHSSAIFDPGIYDEDWTATNYVEGPWWGQGYGIFYGGPVAPLTCFSAFAQTEIGFQPEPSLFRTTFQWPAELGAASQLRISMVMDDGLLLYLNGRLLVRTNVAPGITNVAAGSRATVTVPAAVCTTGTVVSVTNLQPGTNWLAAAVLQSATDCCDTVFGLALSATTFVAPPLPESSRPALDIAPVGANSLRLSWSGHGYALESVTNLSLGSASYPLGPWQEVTNMSNPYTNSLNDPQRFFRLKK